MDQERKITEIVQNCTLPTITKAFVSSPKPTKNNEIFITVSWKRNVYETAEANKFATSYKYEDGENPSIEAISTFPILYADILLEAVSPSFNLKATIKKNVNKDSKKDEFILQIWSKSGTRLQKTINLTSFDKHGQVHADDTFGSFEWSEDESKLVYVAEKKNEKNVGFFTRVVSENDDESKQPKRGVKYEYEESWGELLTDVTNPVICVVDIIKETLEVVDIIEDVSPAQPQWGPNSSLIFEGIKEKPYRLGRIYCENRPSALYQVMLNDNKEVISLTDSSMSAANYCPRLNKTKTKLLFLRKSLSGHGDPHRDAEELMLYCFEKKAFSKAYSVTTYQEKSVELFCHQLPRICWFDDDTHVAVPNTFEAKQYACILNVNSGQLLSMTSCTSLFGVHSNLILSSYMKLDSQSATLQVIKFESLKVSVTRETVETVENVRHGSISNSHGILSHYLIPKFVEKCMPLIVVPHGGPHSVYTDDYSQSTHAFCNLGYAVLLVNYRGSTSFTAESLRSVLGNIGTQDVQEVQNFALQFIDFMEGKIDMKNIYVTGGSHGGFLTAHLIGQYPDFYQAAAMRNPVIEIASMSLVTDIPDWTYVESGLPYTQDLIPTSDGLKSMLEKSPIIHLKNVKAPVLLCIGGKDARVPPSQGIAYYKLLKANNKVVKMLYYPDDSHPLYTVETDGDNFVNICKWFYQHRCTSN